MILPQIRFLVYFINIGIGIVLQIYVWRKRIEPWNGLLILLTAIITASVSLKVWDELIVDLVREETINRIPYYTNLLVASVYCFITFEFTRSSIFKLPWTVITILGLSLIALLLESPESIQVITIPNTWNGPIIAGWGFFMTVSILHMLFAYHRTVYPLHRNRYKYWILVMVILVLGSGLIFIEHIEAGFTLLMVSAVLISLTSLSHQLPDIRQIFKKTIAFLLTTSLSVFIYTGVFILFNSSLVALSRPGSAALLAIVLAVSLVIVANPLINLFHRWVSHQISGNSFDSSRMLGNYSKDISNIIDINHLAREIIQKITDGMHIQYGELFILDKKVDIYVLHLINRSSSGLSSTQRIYNLVLESPIAQWFLRDKRAITQYDLDFHPQLAQTNKGEKDWILNYKMDILVPIYSQNEWIGLLALGPKQNGDRFFEEEVGILQALADQTAVGLRNARLYEDLKQQNAKNTKLNTELSEANEELSRLDQAKSDFISIASHEIRTPLTQIIGYNDILNDMVKSGNIPRTAGLQMIDGVRKAARRLEDIVDTMFDVSMLDTRTLDIHFSDVHLAEIISQSTEKWMMAFEDRKQTLFIKGLEDLPVIQADGRRLKQVFSNLIQNAIKYTPDEGQIRVSGRVIQQSPLEGMSFVEMVVADTGIGIDPEDIEKVFEKFYRVGNVMLHSSGETKFKGAGPGLGLTIARGIIEAHGGKIWAESPGNDDLKCPGCTFHVLLPVFQS